MSKKTNIFLLILIYLIPFCLLLFLLANTFLPKKENVYSKIAKGQPISILVAGDSIGAGSGASKRHDFANLLKTRLLKEYSVTSTVQNTSMGGNVSYSEYVRVSLLPKEDNFDLVILCCGQNDLSPEILSKTYEALIRTVKTKYPNAELISVLQSSQKAYTQKIKTIQSLAKYYGIPTADTIEPFTNGQNGEYKSLTSDGIHPNDKGYFIYAKVLGKLIDEQVQRYKGKRNKATLPRPLFPASLEFVNFQAFPTNIFVREGNKFGCNLNIPEKSHIGIELDFLKGSNYYELVINGSTIIKQDYFRKYPPNHHIIDLTEKTKLKASGESNIIIIFNKQEQADSFKGLFISSPRP